jgi:hypothetical protein
MVSPIRSVSTKRRVNRRLVIIVFVLFVGVILTLKSSSSSSLIVTSRNGSGEHSHSQSTENSSHSLHGRHHDHEQRRLKRLKSQSAEPLVLNQYHEYQQQQNHHNDGATDATGSDSLNAHTVLADYATNLGKVYKEMPSTKICTFSRPIKNNNQHKDLYIYQGDGGGRGSNTGGNENTNNNNNQVVGPQGFMYVKVPKSASTTLSGVNIRLSRGITQRVKVMRTSNNKTTTNATTTIDDRQQTKSSTTEYCISFQSHVVGAGYHYGNRDRTKSFLWGSVRDPATRALSRVFFQFSRGDKASNITDQDVLHFIQNGYHPQSGTITKGRGGFQLQYLTLQDKSRPVPDYYFYDPKQHPTTVQEPQRLEMMVRRVIQDYDFIAVSERIDESLVVLQFLLNLTLSDILVSSSKVGGSYSYNTKEKTCLPLQRPYASPNVLKYTTSDEWYAMNYGDYMLYHAANDSLDRTISSAIGHAKFDVALRRYQDAQRLIETECHDKTLTQCSSTGVVQTDKAADDCYTEDSGCGYKCIDDLAQKMGWDLQFI